MASAALAIADARCSACTCPSERQKLLTAGAIEAARQFMAWQLRDERRGGGGIFGRSIPTSEVVDALQELRDALAMERKARGGA